MKYLSLICAAICALWPACAAAGPRALLIGVTDYAPEVTAIAGTLSGPGHDVALMAKVFADAGLETSDMVILSDGPGTKPAAGRPTRANILSALRDLAGTATPGDQIIVYLAGHGAQVPALQDTTEPDGLDEVFLPSDFRIKPDGGHQNLIRDDEIGGFVDAMIGAGADVWLIADTCHSGSLRRSAGSGAVARFVRLGSGGTTQDASDAPMDISATRTERAGQFVGFYAAAPGALAYETRPQGVKTTHGLMTWTLAQALRSGETQTYDDLARLMSAQLWRIGQGLSEPQFTGATRAAHAFARQISGARLHSVSFGEHVRIGAGRIDGMAPGARIQIEDAQGKALFETTLQDVDLTYAFAQMPVDAMPALDARLRKDGLDPSRFRDRWLADRAPGLVARVLSVPLDGALTVGISMKGPDPALRDQIADLVASMAPALQYDDTNPAVRIVAEGDSLFLRPSSPGAQIGLTVPAQSSALPALETMLRRAAKSRGLLGAATALQNTSLTASVAAEVAIAPGTSDPEGGCQPTGMPSEPKASDLRPPVVHHCETVVLTVRNQHPWPVDVSPFYLAADNQVFFLTGYADAERGGWRIPAGGQGTLTYTEATRQAGGQPVATGAMHLVLFAQRGAPGGTPADFRYLQDAAPAPGTRTSSEPGLASVLTQAGFGLANRRSIDDTVTAQSGAWILPLTTRAYDETRPQKRSSD